MTVTKSNKQMDGHKSRLCIAKESISGLEGKSEGTMQNKLGRDKEMDRSRWQVVGLPTKGTYLGGLSWAATPRLPNLKSSYRFFHCVQSCVPSR